MADRQLHVLENVVQNVDTLRYIKKSSKKKKKIGENVAFLQFNPKLYKESFCSSQVE